jgi:hypothetical protein
LNGNGNGNGKGKGTYPIIEIKEMRRAVQPPVYPRRQPSLLPLAVLCGAVGLVIVLFVVNVKPPNTEPIPRSEAFRWAVNRAMSAAELTQTARSPKEWQQIVNWWQEAIRLMQVVPITDDNHSLALKKVTEYQANLQYAQSRSAAAAVQPKASESIWGVGSRRAMVINVQGQPTSSDRYDSLCKEILHYNKSKVELNNGVVVQFEDFDHKLKATETAPSAPPVSDSWDLGSSKSEVFRIQGTPTRITDYDYSDRETLYYGNSTVELAKQQVIGYSNDGNNLKVHVKPLLAAQKSNQKSSSLWTMDSSREEILRVQGTPTQVFLDSPGCTETFYYGSSTVELKNGFVAGYDNLDKNLRVKAK